MFGPSHYSIHLITCFVIKPALNRSNGLNRRTGQTVQFFANRPHLYLTNICLPFKRPNICLPFIRPMIHQVHSTPNAFKTKTNYKLMFGPSHQAQSNDKKSLSLSFGLCLQAPLAGMFGFTYNTYLGHAFRPNFLTCFHLFPMLQFSLKHRSQGPFYFQFRVVQMIEFLNVASCKTFSEIRHGLCLEICKHCNNSFPLIGSSQDHRNRRFRGYWVNPLI